MVGQPTTYIARPEIERFYAGIMALALELKLQDREIAAVLGLALGRMAGVAKKTGTQADYDTIVDTAVFNMGSEFGNAERLLAAMGRGH